MANEIIIQDITSSSSSDQRYKNIYNKIKDIFTRRDSPTSQKMSQFNNTNFQNLKNISNTNDLINFEHIHYTVNQLRSAIQGKALYSDPYSKSGQTTRYHDGTTSNDLQMLISQTDIDDDIAYINSLDAITTTTGDGHGCKALCVGFCSANCYSACKGCQGSCNTGCNNNCSGGSYKETG